MKLKRALAAGGLGIMLLVFGTMNSVGGSMMSYVMPAYPSWLLYGTTLIYVLFFLAACACARSNPFGREHFSWERQYHYVMLGLWTALNGLFFQFAAFYVDGGLSVVLSNLMLVQIPLFEPCMLPGRRHTWRIWLAFGITVAGVAVGGINDYGKIGNTTGMPGEQGDRWYWVLSFAVSTTFAAIEQVWQDRAFHDERKSRRVEMLPCLFWYNLYSLLAYLVTIPLDAVAILNGTDTGTSVSDAFANQGRAFMCFFGAASPQEIALGHCDPGAGPTVWPLVFCLGYFGMFAVNAYLIKAFGVLYPNILVAAQSAISVFVFSSEAVVGRHARELSLWPFVACAMFVLSIAVAGVPKRVEPPSADIQEVHEGTRLLNGQINSRQFTSVEFGNGDV